MKPHDCTGLNDAQCLHADHFFKRLAHWREQSLADELRITAARGDAQREYPLDEPEQIVMDEYLRERVRVRNSREPKPERWVDSLPVDFVVW